MECRYLEYYTDFFFFFKSPVESKKMGNGGKETELEIQVTTTISEERN